MAGLTAQEIEQQVMGGAVGTVSTPAPIPFATDTTLDVEPMSAADIEEQMLSGQISPTSSGNTTALPTPNTAPVSDLNVSESIEDTNHNDLDQAGLYELYRQKYPHLFDNEGSIIDIDEAKFAGIISPSGRRALDDKGGVHFSETTRPTSPSVPILGDQDAYVIPHGSLGETDLLFDSPSRVPENASEYAAIAEREGKSRIAVGRIDATATEETINNVGDMIAEGFIDGYEITDDEIQGMMDEQESGYIQGLHSPVASMAYMFAQKIGVIDKPTREDVIDDLKRTEALEYMIDSFEDENMRKFFKLAGPAAFESFLNVGNGMAFLGNAYGDSIQFMAEELQEASPDLYAAANLPSPAELADSAMYNTAGMLETVDAILPGFGSAAFAPSNVAAKASAKSSKIAAEIRKTTGQLSRATDEATVARLTNKVEKLNDKFENAVSLEMDVLKATSAREATQKMLAAEKEWNNKLDANVMRSATREERAIKRQNASASASANPEIAQDLITAFEQKTGKVVSVEKDGVKKLDPDLARKAGVEMAEDVANADQKTVRDLLTGTAPIDLTAARVFGQGDEITQPLLRPEKFDGLVASIAELKEAKPDLFKPKKWENGTDYTVIDHLFELTVTKEAMPGDELVTLLNKYDISFEDYILTVVGSGSRAGQILQKLSQIKRSRPTNEMIALQEAKTLEVQDSIRSAIMRIEGVRRGGLVSQLATAARNLQSGYVRGPMEGMGNVIDTALYNASHYGTIKGATSLLDPQNWSDSFRHMKYIFSGDVKGEVRDVLDFIYEQPEFTKQADIMYGSINEIRRNLGRVDELILDYKGVPTDRIDLDTTVQTVARQIENITDPALRKAAIEKFRAAGKFNLVMTTAEDAVEVLNTANRWQEFLQRRAVAFAELQRLTGREYGIDFVQTLKQGKIRDLINDSTTVRPEGSRSFIEIMEEATNRAMDFTYAKQPDIQPLREVSNFIVRNGLTAFIPFPRFMFNGMELMGQYAAGSSIPLTRKLMSVAVPKARGPLTTKDRQRISRNLVAMGVAGPTVPLAISTFFDDEPDKEEEEGVVGKAVRETASYFTKELVEMAAWAGLYQYRTSPDAPGDYKMINLAGGELDTTAIYPVRQLLWMAEATKRLNNGTFDNWYDHKDFMETFVGSGVRTGVGQGAVESVVNAFDGTDMVSTERAAKIAGRALGQYTGSWFVPFSQIIEAERADGSRGLVFKDAAEDPTLDAKATFVSEYMRGLRSRGFFLTGEEEAALPNREFLFQDAKERMYPTAKVLGGLTFRSKDNEAGEYIKRLGITEYELSSKSSVPSIRRFENSILRDAIPAIIEIAKRTEVDAITDYRGSPALQKHYTEVEYITDRVTTVIRRDIAEAKANITNEDKGILADAPQYIVPMLKFRRMPSFVRKEAITEFVLREGRKPNGGMANDMNILAEIAADIKKRSPFK
jgi:hypothetical protein